MTDAIQTTEENNLMRQILLGLVLGLVLAFAGKVVEGHAQSSSPMSTAAVSPTGSSSQVEERVAKLEQQVGGARIAGDNA
jgi:hypothetical protein